MKTTIEQKNWLRNFTLGAGLVLASFLIFEGCATPQMAPGAPAVIAAQVTPAQPAQTVPQVTPATATAPAVTNYITITPAGPAVVTNYLPNQTVMQAIGYANAAAPLIPAPYGTILGGLATLAALIAGRVAQQKNTQLAAAQATSDSHAAAAAAMASVIQSQPPLVTAAMTAAATNGSTAAVATHLQAAGSPT